MLAAEKRICWVGVSLTPYHVARFDAVAALSEIELHFIGHTDVDEFGALECGLGGRKIFQRHILFPKKRLREISKRELWEKLWKELDNIQPNVVCAPGWGLPGTAASLAWSVRNEVPIVLVSESTYVDQPRAKWREWIKGRIVRSAGALFVGGRRHSEYALRLGARADQIVEGHNAVDNRHFERVRKINSSSASDDRYFFACARFEAKKNLIGLIEAYVEYWATSDKAWRLIIAGDGSQRCVIERKIQDCGLGRMILVPGSISYSKLPEYYAGASAFIHASSTEQWGLVVNEAMAAGLPVLVSRQCGCSANLVVDGENGWTFDAHNAKELAFRMKCIAEGTTDLSEMGRKSKEIIRQWSTERFAAGLLAAARIASESQPKSTSMLNWALFRALGFI